jgi:hypothetical protein
VGGVCESDTMDLEVLGGSQVGACVIGLT